MSGPAACRVHIQRISMRHSVRAVSFVLLAGVVACGRDLTDCCDTLKTQPAIRVINAFSSPVDVLVDGSVVIQSLAAASLARTVVDAGSHTILVRPTGSAGSSTQVITAAPG